MPFKLSEDTVDALLDKLSSDDDFRETFQKNPRKALAAVGHKAAGDADQAQGAWTCLTVSRLADKETIRASRDKLREQLLSASAAQTPLHLEVSKR